MIRIVDVDVEPLSIPLAEPFVIASGRIDATRAALVSVTLHDDVSGRSGTGLGEAAALPPVTSCDQPELVRTLTSSSSALRGVSFGGLRGLRDVVDGVAADCGLHLVARAGLESALLFAWAQLLDVPMHRLLGSQPKDDPVWPFHVETDITIPIGTPAHMANLVSTWRALGFRSFKVKVGRNDDDGGYDVDVEAIDAIAAREPGVRLRLDGNAGQTEEQARGLFHRALEQGLTIELLEQPTPASSSSSLASLSTSLPVPVIADESAGSYDDVIALAAAGVSGVNLKLVKHGGPIEAARIGRLARRRRLSLMAGAMVETRVGLAAMLNVVRALSPGPVAIDLDTAFLLASDPFAGGYDAAGPRLTLLDAGPSRR
ncbi:MAG: enolase C-terminal domain-like protein [Deltaproteobacteria bacterium]|nr:enolase C-terminal domain-like protein [Deltaproteobacteria bacterium]